MCVWLSEDFWLIDFKYARKRELCLYNPPRGAHDATTLPSTQHARQTTHLRHTTRPHAYAQPVGEKDSPTQSCVRAILLVQLSRGDGEGSARWRSATAV